MYSRTKTATVQRIYDMTHPPTTRLENDGGSALLDQAPSMSQEQSTSSDIAILSY